MMRKIYLLMICPLCAFFVIASESGARCLIESKQTDATDKITFAVIGDTGTGKKNQLGVALSMGRVYEQEPFGLVLMLGDNIYGGVNSHSFQKRFERPYQYLLAHGVRFQAVLGNHDKGSSKKESGYDPFNMTGRRFYTFARGSGAKGEPLTQFFALDSSRMDGEQLAWLEKELAASQAIWKIAFF